jgi:hypothetical protein
MSHSTWLIWSNSWMVWVSGLPFIIYWFKIYWAPTMYMVSVVGYNIVISKKRCGLCCHGIEPRNQRTHTSIAISAVTKWRTVLCSESTHEMTWPVWEVRDSFPRDMINEQRSEQQQTLSKVREEVEREEQITCAKVSLWGSHHSDRQKEGKMGGVSGEAGKGHTMTGLGDILRTWILTLKSLGKSECF